MNSCDHDWKVFDETVGGARWCRKCGTLTVGVQTHVPNYVGLPIVAGLLADKPAKTELTPRASEADTQLRAEGSVS